MKKLFTLMFLLLGAVKGIYAQEPYAVLSDDNTTLTFYYDGNKASHNGMGVGPFDLNYDWSTYTSTVNSGWYNQRESITSVVFDESFADYKDLTSTAYWFYECENLATITGIDNLKTDNVTSMYSMFEGCSSLASLDLSNFNTEKVTGMDRMFYNCRGLTSLDLSNFNTENVRYMKGMFNACTSLKSLDVSNFNTKNVTDMNGMFYFCSSLTSLDVSNFNTENVTNMGAMFLGCSGLTSLDVSNFNTENVTSMYNMFYFCSSLTSLDVSNFNTENVKEMQQMFTYCEGLTSLDLSNFDTENVTNMWEMFAGCSGLTTIYCNDAYGCESSNDMFYGCTSLVGAISYDESKTDATYANPTTGYFTKSGSGSDPSPSRMPYAVLSDDNTTLTFYYDDNKASRNGMSVQRSWYAQSNIITTVVFDKSFANYTDLTSTAGWFYECSNLTNVNGIENLNTSNVTDMSYMFAYCYSLTSLDLSNFNTANVTNMEQMFRGCSSLTSLDVSNFNTANVTDMGYMFSKCSGLTSLDVSNFNTANVTDMSWMFWNCSSLTNLDLSNFNTANVTDMMSMFYECHNLTSLDVSNFNTANVTGMDQMFSGCSCLTSLDLSTFNTIHVTNMRLMFDDCYSLTSLDLSNFNTVNVTEMDCMFYGCSGLTSLDVSKFNTANVTNMGRMFYGCSSLTSLDMSNFNTANVTNMYMMFSGCSWLKSLDLRNFDTDNVITMMQMFYACSALTTIYCEESWSCASSNDMFNGCTSLKGAISYNSEKTDITVANPTDGYFTATGQVILHLRPYAVLSDDNTKLTFYYDTKMKSNSGMSVGPFTKKLNTNTWLYEINTEWYNHRYTIKTVVFDKSFANYADLISTAYWFYLCSNLTTVNGIENLNTSNVTDMNSMFDGCYSLTSLDVSNFNTANATDMRDMFRGCSGLTTVYCNDSWSCNLSENMFNDCASLVGAISYDEAKTDVTFANPTTGYFTAVAKGDANGDGNISDEDVKTAEGHIMGNKSTKYVFVGADSNGDGKINVADIVDIVNKKK